MLSTEQVDRLVSVILSHITQLSASLSIVQQNLSVHKYGTISVIVGSQVVSRSVDVIRPVNELSQPVTGSRVDTASPRVGIQHYNRVANVVSQTSVTTSNSLLNGRIVETSLTYVDRQTVSVAVRLNSVLSHTPSRSRRSRVAVQTVTNLNVTVILELLVHNHLGIASQRLRNVVRTVVLVNRPLAAIHYHQSSILSDLEELVSNSSVVLVILLPSTLEESYTRQHSPSNILVESTTVRVITAVLTSELQILANLAHNLSAIGTRLRLPSLIVLINLVVLPYAVTVSFNNIEVLNCTVVAAETLIVLANLVRKLHISHTSHNQVSTASLLIRRSPYTGTRRNSCRVFRIVVVLTVVVALRSCIEAAAVSCTIARERAIKIVGLQLQSSLTLPELFAICKRILRTLIEELLTTNQCGSCENHCCD